MSDLAGIAIQRNCKSKLHQSLSSVANIQVIVAIEEKI